MFVMTEWGVEVLGGNIVKGTWVFPATNLLWDFTLCWYLSRIHTHTLTRTTRIPIHLQGSDSLSSGLTIHYSIWKFGEVSHGDLFKMRPRRR